MKIDNTELWERLAIEALRCSSQMNSQNVGNCVDGLSKDGAKHTTDGFSASLITAVLSLSDRMDYLSLVQCIDGFSRMKIGDKSLWQALEKRVVDEQIAAQIDARFASLCIRAFDQCWHGSQQLWHTLGSAAVRLIDVDDEFVNICIRWLREAK